MSEELLTKLQAGRSLASREWPYISAVLFNLKFVKVDGPEVQTLAVDKGWRLYWSPTFVEQCSVKELATALLHESMHCFWEHSKRFERLIGLPKDSKIWNIAGDCAINFILDDDGFEFPQFIRPVRFDYFQGDISAEDTTEVNYAKLLDFFADQGQTSKSKSGNPGSSNQDPANTGPKDQPVSQGEDGVNQDEGGQGGETADSISAGGKDGNQDRSKKPLNGQDDPDSSPISKDSAGTEQNSSGTDQGDSQKGRGQGSPPGEPSKASLEKTANPKAQNTSPSGDIDLSSIRIDCGSAAGGEKRSYELDGADFEAPSIDEATKSIARAEVIQQVQSGPYFGKQANSYFVRAIEELLKPKVSWRRQLAVLVKNSLGVVMGRADYTLMRISRRDHAIKTREFEPRLPAMRGPLPPSVAIILDTSPSITDKNIKDALAEIVGIVRAVGASKSVAVIPCSYHAYEVQYIRTPKQVKYIRPDADSGTDLRSGFEAALTLRKKPDVIIVITDGETPWPNEKPVGVKMVIVLLNNKNGKRTLKPWMIPIIQEG